MQKCKNCERELQKNEVELCLACASSKSHKIKKIIEIASPIILMVGGVALKFLRKK